MKRLVLMYITTLIMIIAGNAIAGSIYKCVDAKGNVSFSQIPCPNKSKGGIIGNSEDSESTPRGERRSLQRGESRYSNPRGESRYSIMNQDRVIRQDQNIRDIKRRIHGSSSGSGSYGSYSGSHGGHDSSGSYGRYGR